MWRRPNASNGSVCCPARLTAYKGENKHIRPLLQDWLIATTDGLLSQNHLQVPSRDLSRQSGYSRSVINELVNVRRAKMGLNAKGSRGGPRLKTPQAAVAIVNGVCKRAQAAGKKTINLGELHSALINGTRTQGSIGYTISNVTLRKIVKDFNGQNGLTGGNELRAVAVGIGEDSRSIASYLWHRGIKNFRFLFSCRPRN